MSQNKLEGLEKQEAEHLSYHQYPEISFYLSQIETMDLPSLFKQLLNYLICLTSQDSEQLLPDIKHQLSSNSSWLAKAALVNALPEKIADLETLMEQTASDSALYTMLNDSKRRLNYISKNIDNKLLEDISQIYTGVHILFNEKLPLNEVRDEVAEYLKEQKIKLLPETTSAQFKMKLTKLKASSIVNSLRLLAKQIKILPIQTDIFIKKFTEDTHDHFELDKLNIQFKANKYVADNIMQQIKLLLSQARELLSERVALRLTKKINTLTVAKVIQNYSEAEKIAESKTSLNSKENIDSTKATSDALTSKEIQIQNEQRKQQLSIEKIKQQEAKNSEDLIRAREETKALEKSITNAELLVKNSHLDIEICQMQLDCATKLKACYSRFSLNYLLRNITHKLENVIEEFNFCLSQMDKTIHWSSLGLTPEEENEMQAMQKSAREELVNSLEKIQDYLKTLDINYQLHETNQTIHAWQDSINEMILSAEKIQFSRFSSHLSQIKNISNEYLRATLIIRYSKLNQKLSNVIINNMASWSERLVDITVVKNTLSYLGIELREENLSKVHPYKINPTKKNNYHKENLWLYLYQNCISGIKNQYECIISWWGDMKIFSK